VDDDSSFREYVAARGPALSRVAFLLTGTHADADDLVQQALANAYVRWSHIVRLDSPDAYVRRIMANQNVSWWRSRRRERLTDHTPDVAVPDSAAAHASTQLVRAAVRSLPPRQRAAVVFRYYEDLDDAAIAAALGCSVATVRSQISRALATLRGHADFAAVVTNNEVRHDNA
jgi:RNA polymerase sigma-70 factor (sigma-E family)